LSTNNGSEVDLTEPYVSRMTNISIGKDNLANFLYAIIYYGAQILCADGSSLRRFSRKQTARFNVEILMKIRASNIEGFEQMTGCLLVCVPKLKLNANGEYVN